MIGDVDFGQQWIEPDGRRGRLTYNERTRQLTYHGFTLGTFSCGRFPTTAGLRLLLAGWADHQDEGISWIWSRIAPLSPCPCCDGIGWRARPDAMHAAPCPLCNRQAS